MTRRHPGSRRRPVPGGARYAVPDEIWADAANHFNEQELAAIVLWIATTNFFNRLNATIRQPAGQKPG